MSLVQNGHVPCHRFGHYLYYSSSQRGLYHRWSNGTQRLVCWPPLFTIQCIIPVYRTPESRPETTKDIKERAVALCPELLPPEKRVNGTIDDLIVVEECTGLRPTRKGGIRLETTSLGAPRLSPDVSSRAERILQALGRITYLSSITTDTAVLGINRRGDRRVRRLIF